MRMSEQAKVLMEQVTNFKSVSRLIVTEEELVLYLITIDEINALPMRSQSFRGEPLADYKVIAMFKDLVLPDSVKVTGDPREKDLLVRPQADLTKKVMTPVEFDNFAVKFYASFKKSPETISVKELRNTVLLTSVHVRGASNFDGELYSVVSETPMLPIELSQCYFNEEYYVLKSSLVINDYWINAFTKVK